MFTVSIDQPLLYSVDDRPQIIGTLQYEGATQGSGELTLVTCRTDGQIGGVQILQESLATISTTDFTFDFVAPLTQKNFAGFFVSAFLVDTTVTATINGVHTDTVTTIDITVTAGAIPAQGWVLVDGSEAMSFVRASASTITATRGIFQTTAAAYTGGESTAWSTSKITAMPNYPFRVDDDFRRFSGNDDPARS